MTKRTFAGGAPPVQGSKIARKYNSGGHLYAINLLQGPEVDDHAVGKGALEHKGTSFSKFELYSGLAYVESSPSKSF